MFYTYLSTASSNSSNSSNRWAICCYINSETHGNAILYSCIAATVTKDTVVHTATDFDK